MTDKELIKQTRARLKEAKVAFGGFWKITRSPTSLTTVWFWGKPKGLPNYYCQFDEGEEKLVWCSARVATPAGRN